MHLRRSSATKTARSEEGTRRVHGEASQGLRGRDGRARRAARQTPVQEPIAFIMGAALLFCLGSETLGKPSFAPVMLDEGFIMADSKFTQRAIKAWSGFGFQVIIATPHGIVESLIDCMERYVTITKDGQERSCIAQATTEQG